MRGGLEASLLLGTPALVIGDVMRAAALSLHLLLGKAAFDLPQDSLALGVVAAVLVLMTLGMAFQLDTPGEVAFLVSVAGGLISNPQGMAFIVLASVLGTIAIGQAMAWMGVKARLTPEQQRRLAALDKALEQDGLPKVPR